MPVAPPTAAAFKAEYPEFEDAPDALVEAKLNQAGLELDATIWGVRAATAVSLLGAHKLACSPFARAMKLVLKTGDTYYLQEYKRLQVATCAALRLVPCE